MVLGGDKMPTKRRWTPEPQESEDREQLLRNEWKSSLPCSDCEVRDICKHAETFHRPDFNPDVFEVAVSCKVKPKVYARFAPNDEAKDSIDFE